MGGNPTAVGHRSMMDLEGSAVSELDDGVRWLVGYRDTVAPSEVLLSRHGGKAAGREAKIHDLTQRDPRANAMRVEPVHLDVPAVAHDQALRSVEEAQALRHVVVRGIEAQVLQTQLFGEAPLLSPPSRSRPCHEENEERSCECCRS